MGKRKQSPEIQKLLDSKLKFQLILQSDVSKEAQERAENAILEIDEQISKLCAERNCDLVMNYTKSLDSSDGYFSQIGMWKLKNQLIPKEMDPPMAKVDSHRNLITALQALKFFLSRNLN